MMIWPASKRKWAWSKRLTEPSETIQGRPEGRPSFSGLLAERAPTSGTSGCVSLPEGGDEELADRQVSGSLMIQARKAPARARKSQGVTQYELSQRTGVWPSAISRIENGRGNALLDVIESLAQGSNIQLGINIERRRAQCPRGPFPYNRSQSPLGRAGYLTLGLASLLRRGLRD